MRAVLLAAVAGTLTLAAIAALTLADLHRARAANAVAAEGAVRPTLAGPAGHTLIAPDAAAAKAALATRIGDDGAAAGLRLTLTPLNDAAAEPIVAVQLIAYGDEARLLRFAAAVEQAPPLARMTRWSIAPDGDGALRLSADIAAPWRR